MKLTDDEWVAQARSRVARGKSWERAPGSALRLMAFGNEPSPPGQSELRCPYCEAHPPLEEVHTRTSASPGLVLRCRSCYGFWLAGEALTGGLSVSADDDPAFFAAMAPPRCRACGGWLRENETCVRCHQSLPRLNCPRCGKEMQRAKERGITLDTCDACKGTWFDTGEIGQVFGLEPEQSLASRYIEQREGLEDPDEEPPLPWMLALDILLRLFVPFIP